MRVLLTTVALRGHFFPLVPLGWACRAAGHDVLLVVPDGFLPTVLASGLPVAGCGPVADFLDLAETVAVRDLDQLKAVHGRAFGRIAAWSLPGITSLVEAWRPDLVVSERAEFGGPLAAAARQIPHVELQWSVAELPEYRRAAATELREGLRKLGMAAIPEPVRILSPWPPSLRQPHAIRHHAVRHIAFDGAAPVPGWLLADRDRLRICVTLGTVLPELGIGTYPISELVFPMLEHLASLDVELLVAVDDRVAAGWPRLPPAVRYAGWLPLSQVVPACDLLIHHGGHGTTLTALAAGCPQLVLPQFDDQLDNAEAVVTSGAGMCVFPHASTPQAVASGSRELIEEPRFAAAAAKLSAEIAAQPSPTEVVTLLHRLAS